MKAFACFGIDCYPIGFIGFFKLFFRELAPIDKSYRASKRLSCMNCIISSASSLLTSLLHYNLAFAIDNLTNDSSCRVVMGTEEHIFYDLRVM